MLSQRILSAAWGLAILLLFLRWWQPWFAFLLALMGLLAVREFYLLALPEKPQPLYLFGQVWTVLFVLSPLSNQDYVLPVLITTAVVFSLLLDFPRPHKKPLHLWVWNLAGIFYVGWLLRHYVLLMGMEKGKEMIVLLLFSTFACDTASYFIGSAWGKRKMAPAISPGKTWEGAAGGFGSAILAALVLGTVLNLNISYWHMLALGVLVAVLGPLGDLAESMLKRDAGVKDTGSILPGHGGLLDRIDSVLFVGAGGYYYIILTGLL